MEKIEDMEIRNNHKNQKTVKTASAIFSESLKSLMPFFANNEKKGSRVKEGEAPTNLQLISFLSPTTVSTSSRKWAHIAAMVAMLLIIGVGDVWGTTVNGSYTFGSSAVSGWTCSPQATYCGLYYSGKKSDFVVYNNNITNISGVNFSAVTSPSITIRVKGITNDGTNSFTVSLVNSSGKELVYSTAQTDQFASTSDSGAATWSENIVLTPVAGVTGYKITCNAKTCLAGTDYSLTYTPVAVATPTFSPVAGTYNNNQSVTISCATASSNIYYTTNGTTPTSSSTAYTGAITVSTDNTTIKAIAIKGGDKSSVASATYRLTCATPTFSVAEGTYNNDQSVALSCETEGAAIHYTTDGTNPTSSSPTYSSALSISSTQTLKAIAIKSGYTNSSIASATYTMVCVDPTITLAGGTYYDDQSTTISTTTAGATIRYTLDGTTPTESSAVYSSAIAITSSKTLKAKVFKSGYTASSMVSAAYTLKCAQPTYTATGSYAKSIEISCTTTDAVIRYTLDGSDPTESSDVYSVAINIPVSKTLKARAFKTGYTTSIQASTTYTIKCATPTSSPAVGTTHTGSADITLSSDYGTIYYNITTDGSTPDAPDGSSTEYTEPIHITTTTKIKAVSIMTGCTTSNQLSGTYTIQYNVTWMVDGAKWTPSSSGGTDGQALVNSGTHISTLPTAPTTGDFCGDRFMGWTDAEGGAYVHGSSGLYTTASGFPNATGDQVFYAVFADYAE